LRTETGNIWIHLGVRKVVVPTNIGWKKTGANVMGAGLAKQAAEVIDKKLPLWYGEQCQRYGADTPVLEYELGLVMFPVKPLNELAPHLSWKQRASLKLIERSTIQLAEMYSGIKREIAIPMVGCGNGGLDPSDVRPILAKHLDDKFLLVLEAPNLYVKGGR
jgi:hypothetical protein